MGVAAGVGGVVGERASEAADARVAAAGELVTLEAGLVELSGTSVLPGVEVG